MKSTEKKFSFLSPIPDHAAPVSELSETQVKVIRDKYLKEDPTVEVWLKRVARNIALGELLYHESAPKWGLFDGVRVSRKEFPGPAQPTRLLLFHADLHSSRERELNFKRFLDNCEAATEQYPEAKELVDTWAGRFYALMSNWSFLPNSPTLMNAGRDLQQLSACYVLPVEDSIEEITGALQAQALIHKSGGGTGFSFEKVRPSGDPVKSTAGVASGALSFMKLFDRMTEVVKQGGNRRGANMGILPTWHPEIREFISVKSRPGQMENFNLSVAVDDTFFEAVEQNWDYELINPRTRQSVGRASASDIFNMIVENAWISGDPGLIFTSNINSSNSNPTPVLGPISATNPCGEQPLYPNEACNLGSLNLSKFVEGPLLHGTLNWDRLGESIDTAMRFLDDIIDVNNYPLAEIERITKLNRRIGLGIMGWAETLVRMGLPYDSTEALELAEKVMGFVNDRAMKVSESLAEERGVFPNWKNSIYDAEGPHFGGMKASPRHAARTTIAPTGTIAMAAGLQGAGIEPFYAIAYTRYNGKALEALKSHAAPSPDDVYFEVNSLFKEVARQHNFFGMKEPELWKKIEKNGKSIWGIEDIPDSIQRLFRTAHDVSIEWHVKMQAAFQHHTDNAVSKTINLPHSATKDDVRRAFLLARDMKLKGLTIYRDGSRQQQVLNLIPNDKKVKKARDLSVGVSSEYYEIRTGHGPLHVHIHYDEDGPYKVFASLEPVGTELAGLASLVGILVTQFLEQGGNPNVLVRHLNSIKGDRPTGLGENRVNSIPHAMGIALRHHLFKHGWLDTTKEQQPELEHVGATASPSQKEEIPFELWSLTQVTDQCPKCFSSNISFNSGCSGPLCMDCGFSECS